MADETVWIKLRYDTKQAERDLKQLDKEKKKKEKEKARERAKAAKQAERDEQRLRGNISAATGVPTDLTSLATQVIGQSTLAQGVQAQLEKLVSYTNAIMNAVNSLLANLGLPSVLPNEKDIAQSRALESTKELAGRVKAAGGQLSNDQIVATFEQLLKINERQLKAQEDANEIIRKAGLIPGGGRR